MKYFCFAFTSAASGVGVRFGNSSSNPNLSSAGVPALSTPGSANSVRQPQNDKTPVSQAKKVKHKNLPS